MTDKLTETFAPIAVPPDSPGYAYRAHLMQNPSDQLRDAARDFAKRVIGLVPDPEFHGPMIDVLHDLVVTGERRLQAVLETRADFVRDGHRFKLEHAPLRAFGRLLSGEPSEIGRILEPKAETDGSAQTSEQSAPAGAEAEATQASSEGQARDEGDDAGSAE